MRQPPLIGIVGPCASGKSTLIKLLTDQGYHCRHIAQEHSYVQDMWKRLSNPDILVYLDVTYETTLRRKKLNWTQTDFQIQLDRLKNARQFADIFITTDSLSPTELAEIVIGQINSLIN